VHRVYPGKGIRFVTRTGQLVVLSGSKSAAMYHQKKKPAKLVWTQVRTLAGWRRATQ
jgi:ribosomal protein L24E